MITAEELRELLRYEPETGDFWWRVRGLSRKMYKPAGTVNGQGYRQIGINYRQYRVHRLAWLYVHGNWPKEQIDHINGIKTDNRLCNLREASRVQNQQNKAASARNTSGFKGVSWHKRSKKWRAQIRVNRKQRCIGSFKCKYDAHAAYREASEKYHGAFSKF